MGLFFLQWNGAIVVVVQVLDIKVKVVGIFSERCYVNSENFGVLLVLKLLEGIVGYFGKGQGIKSKNGLEFIREEVDIIIGNVILLCVGENFLC